MSSSYNDINQSHLHYGRYGTGNTNYYIGHHHHHLHHPLHRLYGGNSAIQYWDKIPKYVDHTYLNQYGGSGYTTTIDTSKGGRKRRIHRRKRRSLY